jgi:hypothetical protein
MAQIAEGTYKHGLRVETCKNFGTGETMALIRLGEVSWIFGADGELRTVIYSGKPPEEDWTRDLRKR